MKRSDISDDDVIRACADARRGKGPALDLLISRKRCPDKVAIRAMERAVDRGLIDYGVSIRYAWVA